MSYPILNGEKLIQVIFKNNLNIDLEVNQKQLNEYQAKSRASRIYLQKKKKFFEISNKIKLLDPKCLSDRNDRTLKQPKPLNLIFRCQNPQKYQSYHSNLSQNLINEEKEKSVSSCNNCSYSEKIFIEKQLENRFKRVDPTFKIENYTRKPRMDKILSKTQNTKMLQILDLEKSTIKQYKSRKIYKAHNYFIRKLQRIYQNKEKGETELSTKENEELRRNLQRDKQVKDKTPNQEARLQKWLELKKKKGESKTNLQNNSFQAENQDNIIYDNRQKNIFAKRMLQRKVQQLKKSQSPLNRLVLKFKKLIDHYYIDFNVKLKQIIDFYCDSHINTNEDELKTYESVNQEQQFQQQILMVMDLLIYIQQIDDLIII